jgi:hypothetical protein
MKKDFIFYLSSRSSVLSRGIYWVSCEVQKIKNLSYHKKLLSGQTYPTPSQILETLARHVRPLGETCPASQPYPRLTKPIWLVGRILEAFLRHVRALT